jgi:hypothetical protein
MKLPNFYYEFPTTISVFGRPGGGYYVQRGCLPVYHKHKAVDASEWAQGYAVRVWEEYEDGTVKLTKNYNALSYDNPGPLDYNEQEFLLVKLRASDINE